MAVLQAIQGVNPGQVFPIEGDVAVLGRHPDCDIVLESAAVSRQHARVVRLGDHCYIEDLGSRNGTFLNGRPVSGRQILSEGDRVAICDLVFVFHHDPPTMELPRLARTGEDIEPALFVDEDLPGANSTIMSKLDVSSGSSGVATGVNPEAKLRALIEIGQNLGKALSLNEVLPKLLDSLFAIFVQADRGFIVLREPVTGRLVPKAVKYRSPESGERLRISRTIVNGVLATKEAILSADAAADARFDMAESIVDFHIRSMMCVPLVTRDGKALGVIQVDTLNQRNRFGREDLEVLASVACQAAYAVENAQLHELALREQALDRELALAHKVQRGFLPAAPPQVDGYGFYEFYEPAHELGGDYYDYVSLPNGRLGVVVADVAGKGISASLLMAKLSSDTRYCLASEATPAGAMARLNRIFCNSGWEDRFVTMVLTVLDPQRHEVTIVNAGHLPPLLRRSAASVVSIAEAETRLPLGVLHDVDYMQHTLTIEPGDSLVLYTDGITEAMNDVGELYGSQRLWQKLQATSGTVRALGRGVLDDVRRFVGTRPQSDDMCVACFGRER